MILYSFQKFLLISFLFLSCNTGKLTVIADIPKSLKEASACEIMPHSDLIWVIEDAGNKNHIYGLNEKGSITKDIAISNAKNIDWEDLTSDDEGNLYIGDFGNNSRKRENFTIYKVSKPEDATSEINAEAINFKLPKGKNPEDFESFFLYHNSFYVFSKESKNFVMLKVPNTIGDHTATLAKEFNLEGKNNHITSADISKDGKTVVLLNHDKVWKLTDYESDDFFGGTIEVLDFGHNSQKEGVCFKTDALLYITDEREGNEGNNIYSFKL